MLLVGELDLLAREVADLGSDAVITHREPEDLRHHIRSVGERELPFLRLADPALLGKLLHEARSLATGVGEVERNRHPEGERRQRQDDEEQHRRDLPFSLALRLWRRGQRGTSVD